MLLIPFLLTPTCLSSGKGHTDLNGGAVCGASTESMAAAGTRGYSCCSGRLWEQTQVSWQPRFSPSPHLGCLATHRQSRRDSQRLAHSSGSTTSSCHGPGTTVCRRFFNSVPRSSWKSFSGERCPGGWVQENDWHIGPRVLIDPVFCSFRGSNTRSLVWALCVFST